jgi:hypothetical protein
VDFAMDFSSDFSGKVEEFVQNGLKIFKISVKVNSQQPIRDPATVDFVRESDHTVDYGFQKLTGLRLPRFSSNDCRVSTSPKKT